MTRAQALREARRRWGHRGVVRVGTASYLETKTGPRAGERVLVTDTHVVGTIEMGLFFLVKADGPTFEAAFRKYDQRELRTSDYNASRGQPCPECTMTMREFVGKTTTWHARRPTWIEADRRHVCGVCAKKHASSERAP